MTRVVPPLGCVRLRGCHIERGTCQVERGVVFGLVWLVQLAPPNVHLLEL